MPRKHVLHRQDLTDDMLKSDKEIFRKIRFKGNAPSPEDPRDYTPAMVGAEVRTFPKEYEAPETEILNQGSIGSCVAHSCASALASGEETAQNNHAEYSRGYIYGNRAEGQYEGEGMYVREALSQLHKCGDVYYKEFPYNHTYPKVKALIEEKKEQLAEKAAEHKIINYYRCYTEWDIKAAIMDRGGVIISIPVYSDFGRNLHKTETNKLTGHHAMLIVGWNKDNQWIVQNSWGEDWGYSGKLLMDMDYPVSEYWGITLDQNKDIPVKKNIFARLIKIISKFFKKLFKK